MPRLTITLTKPVRDELLRLVQTGLHGRTPAEVAERLICQHLLTVKRWSERIALRETR